MKEIFLTSAQIKLVRKVIIQYCLRTRYVTMARENGDQTATGQMLYEHSAPGGGLDRLPAADREFMDLEEFSLETEILATLQDPALQFYVLCTDELEHLDHILSVYRFMQLVEVCGYQRSNNLNKLDLNLIEAECDEILELENYLCECYSDEYPESDAAIDDDF